MNYGNILTTTWKTIWKEKVIIWFGMLMMLAPALTGILFGIVLTFSSPAKVERFVESAFEGIGLVIFFFAYFAFIAFSVLLTALSFIGAFKGTLLAQNSDEPITLRALFGASMPYLWRMLGVMFTVGLALGLLYSLPLFFIVIVGTLTAGIAFLCALPLILLFIPVGIIGYLLLSLSMAALIAEDSGVIEALQSAWKTLKAKFWHLVLMTVILSMLKFGIGMSIAIPVNILQLAFITPLQAGNIHYFGIFMTLFIPFSAIVQSLGLTYVNSAWMLSYLEASPAPAPLKTENEIVEYDA